MKIKALTLFAVVVTMPSAVNGARSVVYDTVPAGQAAFDSTVAATGGTVETKTLTSGTAAYGDFTINKNPNSTYPQIVGALIDIFPSGTAGNPASTRASGVTFNFAAPVNSFGLNVGDWGTCCFPSGLYIAFDGGTPIQVGVATNTVPAPLTNGQFSIFVGAFDDSATFSAVEFWGDGVGEALYAGGTLRYAQIDVGSLPGAVPEPATWAMMMLGVGATGAAMRRSRRRKSELLATV